MKNKNLAILIFHSRKKKGISLDKLSKEVGVNASFISKIENGDRKLPSRHVHKLCDLLDIDINVLVSALVKDMKEELIMEINEYASE